MNSDCQCLVSLSCRSLQVHPWNSIETEQRSKLMKCWEKMQLTNREKVFIETEFRVIFWREFRNGRCYDEMNIFDANEGGKWNSWHRKSTMNWQLRTAILCTGDYLNIRTQQLTHGRSAIAIFEKNEVFAKNQWPVDCHSHHPNATIFSILYRGPNGFVRHMQLWVGAMCFESFLQAIL